MGDAREDVDLSRPLSAPCSPPRVDCRILLVYPQRVVLVLLQLRMEGEAGLRLVGVGPVVDAPAGLFSCCCVWRAMARAFGARRFLVLLQLLG